MKLTRQGRRELHDEIFDAIVDTVQCEAFVTMVTNNVLSETSANDGFAIDDASWRRIVRKEVDRVIRNLRLQTPENIR